MNRFTKRFVIWLVCTKTQLDVNETESPGLGHVGSDLPEGQLIIILDV